MKKRKYHSLYLISKKIQIKILNLQLKEQHFQTKISQNIELFTKNYNFEKIKIFFKLKKNFFPPKKFFLTYWFKKI